MSQSLRALLAGSVACAFVFVAVPFAAQAMQVAPNQEVAEKETYTATKMKVQTLTEASSEVSVAEVIEFFILLGIIPADKVEQARTVLTEKGVYDTEKTGCLVSALQYNLYLGLTDVATNGEVTRLQTWLATMPEIYPEGLVTGYFGPATEQAVQRYQAKNGIVSSGAPETTGYGVVGPKTRKIMNACHIHTATQVSKEKEAAAGKKEKEADEKESVVSSITLEADEDNGKVYWEVDGYATSGYKVVWSKDEGPTYPTRDGDKYQYHSDPAVDHAALNAFDGDGTYHVRVCEYLGGTCGTYSNEVTLEL